MTEKDMNIEDEDILNEQVSEETDKEAETEGTVNPEDSDMTENADETEEQDPIEKAQKEIAELKDKWLRSVAEFENYRKRTLKERTELILNGGEKFITAVLPILDDMERAIENGTKTDGVSRIDTDNADFDTDVHEAVAMVPGMGDDKKGKVIDCLQQGYKLNDKVIRHAKVAVGQ